MTSLHEGADGARTSWNARELFFYALGLGLPRESLLRHGVTPVEGEPTKMADVGSKEDLCRQLTQGGRSADPAASNYPT